MAGGVNISISSGNIDISASYFTGNTIDGYVQVQIMPRTQNSPWFFTAANYDGNVLHIDRSFTVNYYHAGVKKLTET